MHSVSKRYSRRGPLVLDGVSLRLAPGTLAVVRGANGSGKSTLLRLAVGCARPTTGRVVRREPRPGWVPDRVAPAGGLTVRSYLGHMARIAGCPPATAEVAQDISGRLELLPGLDARLGSLSRGNLRKAILIQALMRDAGLVVMDEPEAGLDDAAQGELKLLVRERLGTGCSILVATHHDLLDDLGGRYHLVDGRLVAPTGES